MGIGHSEARHGMVRPGGVGLGEAGMGKVRLGLARVQGFMNWYDRERNGVAGPGLVGRGLVWRCGAMLGGAGYGEAL